MSNTLVAEERKMFRRSVLTKLRNDGKIPAVVYGRHEPSKSIAVKNIDLLKVIRENGKNGIISLDINGKSENVILEDFQWNPLNHDIIHADFLHINMTNEIHAKVHVDLIGTSKGEEEGGILQQSLHELNISAKPRDIPEVIEVDISNLGIGHTVNIGAIRNNYSHITINHDDDEVIATLLSPKFEKEDDSIEEQSENIQTINEK
ncbi:50S ribosomal protein L25/general stress protein Ctc [Bacillus massilinigeriensis]|uniref:50S ribosomal protein L25/general stress protein Ctc n=1 Tax=Bacillus massilionigeriensis TaxID=1805475 RepID=UPI00096B45B4|nr:50S ribosomal protein L25/general stress protein Ctc [Bacillus massilionigeriensis]